MVTRNISSHQPGRRLEPELLQSSFWRDFEPDGQHFGKNDDIAPQPSIVIVEECIDLWCRAQTKDITTSMLSSHGSVSLAILQPRSVWRLSLVRLGVCVRLSLSLCSRPLSLGGGS